MYFLKALGQTFSKLQPDPKSIEYAWRKVMLSEGARTFFFGSGPGKNALLEPPGGHFSGKSFRKMRFSGKKYIIKNMNIYFPRIFLTLAWGCLGCSGHLHDASGAPCGAARASYTHPYPYRRVNQLSDELVRKVSRN